jgi:hypothetical protein
LEFPFESSLRRRIELIGREAPKLASTPSSSDRPTDTSNDAANHRARHCADAAEPRSDSRSNPDTTFCTKSTAGKRATYGTCLF